MRNILCFATHGPKIHTHTDANSPIIDYYSESFALRRPQTLMSMSIHNYTYNICYLLYISNYSNPVFGNCGKTLYSTPFWHRKLYSSHDPPNSIKKFKLLHSNIVMSCAHTHQKHIYTKSPMPSPPHSKSYAYAMRCRRCNIPTIFYMISLSKDMFASMQHKKRLLKNWNLSD